MTTFGAAAFGTPTRRREPPAGARTVTGGGTATLDAGGAGPDFQRKSASNKGLALQTNPFAL
jgi:hypothetical protein